MSRRARLEMLRRVIRYANLYVMNTSWAIQEEGMCIWTQIESVELRWMINWAERRIQKNIRQKQMQKLNKPQM